MRTRGIAAIGLSAIVVLGCKSSGGHAPEPVRAVPSITSSPSHESTLAPSMLRHEALGLAIRDAVVRADLASARRGARELSRVRISPKTPEFGERLIDMQVAASNVAQAEDLREAARAFGELATTCADCHARLTGPTRTSPVAAPSPHAGPRGNMRRHAWAMNQLWSGLMGNSELPWRAGAAVLAERSLFAEDLLPQKTPVPPVEELAATLQRIAVRAQAATDTGVRGEIFGELLATCAGCHELTDHDVRNGSLRFE